MEDPATVYDSRALTRGWQAVLGRLQLELNPHHFATWLKGTRALRSDGQTLVVEARSAIACEWLNHRLNVMVLRAMPQGFTALNNVWFVPPGAVSAPAEAAAAGPTAPAPNAHVVGKINCEYTFEGYVAGDGNLLAIEACRALVEPSELRVSPVVLYGSPGMGKTHLLHALACRARDLGKRVACLNADEFANRFLSALNSGRADDFKATVRATDLLIIDDLQAIATKKATLEELVHTMEAVTNDGGGIVVASERNPFELGLPERLESRLSAGIVTRVDPFEREERRAFIEVVARRHRSALPAWAIDRIASAPAGSVRVLLGYVNGALALDRNNRLEPGTLDARLAGTAAVEAAGPHVAHAALLKRVAIYFNVAADELCGRARTARVNDGRAVAVATLHAHGASLSEIAVMFSKRDKSTIHGLCARGRTLIEADESLRAALSLLA